MPACSRRPRPPATCGIGVDSDQYNVPTLADVKDVIITSMVKNVDVAVYDLIASIANGDAADRQHSSTT